ncbi:MAG: four helix bundle protein [Parcubacteria group bacterium]
MPAVITKEKETYSYWLTLHRNFPKTERYGLGRRIDQIFLEVLESSFTATYLPPEQKVLLLGKIISRLDILKFYSQLAWENKLIPNNHYIDLSQRLEEIGRMLGGWRKGLLEKKTPAK